ncbi:MAG: tyrosine-type recombinase/integrase, partial [Rhizobiaceae bacterium]|nr:tyrosine-type recombinase/integrase [Rhizobiaceae bacterium]
ATPATRREVPDSLLPGLYLVVQPSGAKSWAVRYRADGRPRKHTIGRYPRISLAQARDLGRELLRAVAEGRDPAAEKQAACEGDASDRIDTSFARIVEEFVARHVVPNNKPSTANETRRLFAKVVAPQWGDRDIKSITKQDVSALLDNEIDRGAPINANRVHAALSKLFNWCVDREILDASPCERVRKPSKERSRDRVLADWELALILEAAKETGWPFGDFVRLLALTGQRRSEVAGMKWSEIDLDEMLWTIPAARTKNGEVHQVPLSEAVVDILQAMPRIAGPEAYVLTTTGRSPISGFSRAKTAIDKQVACRISEDASKARSVERWTYHDLRRTVASGMARLGVDLPVIEKILNHKSGSFAGIVAVYQRHGYANEKRSALDAWALHVQRLNQMPRGEVQKDKSEVSHET